MRASFFLNLFGAAAVLMAAATPGRADSKRNAPAVPNPDLVAIRDSISALAKGPLHDLADGQTVVNTRIDRLEAEIGRAARGWDNVDLAQMGKDAAATRGAVAGVLSGESGIERELEGVTAQLQSEAEGFAAARQDWVKSFGAEDAKLARLQTAEVEAQERWERALSDQAAASLAAQQAATQSLHRPVWLLGGGLALLIAAAAGLQARARRVNQRDVLLAISRFGTELRQATAKAPAAPNGPGWQELERRLARVADRLETQPGTDSLPSGSDLRLATAKAPAAPNGPGWEELERRLARIADRLEAQPGFNSLCLEPPRNPPWGTAYVNGTSPEALGGGLRNGSSPGLNGASSAGDRPTVSMGREAEPSVASRLLWPAEFLNPESPLSRWRFLLESHFEDTAHPALPVLGSLLGLRALLSRPGAGAGSAEIGAAAFRLSEALYTYLQSLPEISAEDCQQASAAWLRSIRSLITAAAPRVELREVLPGSRVDPDLMHPVREGPGNHLAVADVFSWAVLDRSTERPKVLHRALVASS